MQTTLIDSPVANTANIARALRATGAELCITRDAEEIAGASKLVLPGVGSFVAAMQWLREMRIDDAIRDAVARGAFLLGICVGHQLLFDVSEEMEAASDSCAVRCAVSKEHCRYHRSDGIACRRERPCLTASPPRRRSTS
jgi:imidazoleglycerol phosphate synthase glutamine amidotransferase subunit HisH